MRKFILILPLVFLPAVASASHDVVAAISSLDARAARLHQRLTYVPGNWQLKQEAFEFAIASERLARQARRGRGPQKLMRSLRRLNAEFYDLRFAARNAHLGYKKRQRLQRELRRLSRTLGRVEYALEPQWRRGAQKTRSRYGYVYDDSNFDRPARRYRH